jgi:hypothetical protein
MHIKLALTAIFESLCRALIRFFDNRFVRDNDVEWYRMELNKAHEETQLLYRQLIMPPAVRTEIVEEENFQPLSKSKFQSWSTKRQQLERESYQRAMNLAAEARQNIERNKTTEELELELLGNNSLSDAS